MAKARETTVNVTATIKKVAFEKHRQGFFFDTSRPSDKDHSPIS
ncbi:hypothetical protein SynRS9915_01830 [Synechococcus sp. RS9915]|nr:hypothetical protein SynRS9915_01830 [Synechococcus sp. RS9915]